MPDMRSVDLNLRLLGAGVLSSDLVDRGNGIFALTIGVGRDGASVLKDLSEWEELALTSFDLNQHEATFTVTFQ